MLFRHATSNKTAAQLKRSVFFSEYACRRMEIATWGLFMKGKFRSSQMCSNFSKQLKLHNSISELSCCKAPVCKYLPPKSLFFFCLSYFYYRRQHAKKLRWQILKFFVLFFLYSQLGFSCLFYLSHLSVPKLQEATGVFKYSKSFLK